VSEEEVEQLKQLIRAELAGINTVREADAMRITRLEETAKTLLGISQNLVTLAQSHDERADRLDERVDKLAATIERYVTGGRGTNGTGKKGSKK
jgi:hypothetical protein